MNELSVQQAVKASAQASAPNTQTDGVNGGSSPPPVSTADTRKASVVEEGVSLNKDGQDEKTQDDKQLEQAVAQLNDYVQNSERKLEFSMDDDSGKTVVRVYDANSDELIRQMPNEEALELAQRLSQEEPLMLFSANV
jgi:flagellar protein FlaG